jgi:hypothetical protein
VGGGKFRQRRRNWRRIQLSKRTEKEEQEEGKMGRKQKTKVRRERRENAGDEKSGSPR